MSQRKNNRYAEKDAYDNVAQTIDGLITDKENDRQSDMLRKI